MTRLVLLLGLLLAGCSHVSPWQRELLADPAMTFGSEDAEDAPLTHAQGYREGGTSAASATGGGCGCN